MQIFHEENLQGPMKAEDEMPLDTPWRTASPKSSGAGNVTRMSADEFLSSVDGSGRKGDPDVSWMSSSLPEGKMRRLRKDLQKSPSYMLSTESSYTRSKMNEVRGLQKSINRRRILEEHKKHLVAEQKKLSKVYDHTIDELMSEKRQHNMIRKQLKETTMEMKAAKHENGAIRKKLRSVYKESESWKRQALQVTTSLQEHVRQLKEENEDLALQNELLKNSYTQTLEYSKEIQRLKASYKNLETKHIDASKDQIFNEKSTEKFYRKYKHVNYLYELEKAETKKLNANTKQLLNKLEKSDRHAQELRNEIDLLKKAQYESTVKLQNQLEEMESKLKKAKFGETVLVSRLKSKGTLLQRLWASVETCKSSKEAFAVIEQLVCQLTDSHQCILYLKLLPETFSSANSQPNETWTYDIQHNGSDSLVGTAFLDDAMLTGLTIFCPSVKTDSRYNSNDTTISKEVVSMTLTDLALLCAPVRSENRGYIGALQVVKYVDSESNTMYQNDDEILLCQVASFIGTFVEMWSRIEKAEFNNQDQKKMCQNKIELLQSALERNAVNIKDHLERNFVPKHQFSDQGDQYRAIIDNLKEKIGIEMQQNELSKKQVEDLISSQHESDKLKDSLKLKTDALAAENGRLSTQLDLVKTENAKLEALLGEFKSSLVDAHAMLTNERKSTAMHKENSENIEKQFRESKQELQLLEAVNKISVALVKAEDVDEVFSTITEAACKLVSAERATLFLANSREKILWSKVATGLGGRIEVPFGKGIVGDAFKRGESIKVDDTSTDSRFGGNINAKEGEFVTKALLCASVFTVDNLKYGVLQALNKSGGDVGSGSKNNSFHFSNQDLHQLEAFAHEIGSLVQRWMNHFDTAQRIKKELDNAIASEGNMVELIHFILKCGGDALNTNLRLAGNITTEDVLYMLPAGKTSANERAASRIQAIYRGKKIREAFQEEHPELYAKIHLRNK
eukprot:g5184.t1